MSPIRSVKARFLLGFAISLLAISALAQDRFPALRIEGEFEHYSGNLPMENMDVARSGPEFVPPGQRLRIARSAEAGEHGFLWTWLPPLHPELCTHPFWQKHCAEAEPQPESGVDGEPKPERTPPPAALSVPVRITPITAEGTPVETSDDDFRRYWELAVLGLAKGQTVYRIQAEDGGPEVWAYVTEDGYLGTTPRVIPRFDPAYSWSESRLVREIQVLNRVAGVHRSE